MDKLKLSGITLNRIGLGTNRIRPDDQSRNILSHAVEHGVNFIDTAHTYTGGLSESVIGETLSAMSDKLVIASKCGLEAGTIDGRPEVLASQLEQSLKSLKTNCISLYQLHRVDPNVAIELSVGTLRSFQAMGKIQHIGLSEVTLEQIKQAQTVATIASVQNHYNLNARHHDDVLDYCEAQGIIFIPFFPLGGKQGITDSHIVIDSLARKYQVSTQQLAIAWLLKRSPVMLPIPGTLSRAHLDDNLAAAQIELSSHDFDLLK
jgi:pyridoxine 4-dehydrogenase